MICNISHTCFIRQYQTLLLFLSGETPRWTLQRSYLTTFIEMEATNMFEPAIARLVISMKDIVKFSHFILMFLYSHVGIPGLRALWPPKHMERNEIFIRHAENHVHGEKRIQNYSVDGYCEETNTVCEFLGCPFHGHCKYDDPKKLI